MPGHRLTALACVCALALLTAPAPALAQTDAPQNSTAGQPDQPDTEVTDQLGDLVVHSYEYSDGQMVIDATWRGETPETVTLTEMIELDSAGSTEISFKTARLLPGERTELTIAAEERAGGTAAVLVTTPQSTANNEALVLQAGEPSTWPTVGLDSAIFASGLSAATAAGFTFLFVLRRKHAEERGVDRIA
jgi:hypothetical protein